MSENTRDYFTGTCCSTMHTKGHMASLQRFVPATSRIRFNKLNYLQHDGGTKFAQNKIFFPPLDTCPHRIPIFRSRHMGFCLVAQPWTYKKVGGPSKPHKDFPWHIPNLSGLPQQLLYDRSLSACRLAAITMHAQGQTRQLA